MVYVIFMLGLLSILGVGFVKVGQSGLRCAIEDHAYIGARVKAESIHRAVCQIAAEGKGELGQWIEEQSGEDVVLKGYAEEEQVQAEIWIREKEEEDRLEIETDAECDGYHFSFIAHVSYDQEGREEDR